MPEWPREDLFLVNGLGQRLRRLTHLAERINEPAWSPDGRRLTFELIDDRRSGLWIMNVDGSDARRVVQGESLTWSPNGKRIAFAQYDRFDVPSVFIANPDGSARRDSSSTHWGQHGRLTGDG